MEPDSIIEEINHILNTNAQVTEAQREALETAKKYIKPRMTVDDIIEVIKILGVILTMSHSK